MGKSTSKRRKTTETPDDNAKGPRKTNKKTKDKKEKGKDKNKARKSKRRKRPQATEDGGEKAPVKKPKRPRVGHLECGRFPRSFPTQVGHRVKQHRRDGAPVSTHALGKAPKGTQTKMSIARRRRNKPSRAVKRWKLRSSLRRIGTIVILLAGRHRGKRAVIVGRHRFSGLLLITGPLKCNGIPVRRVHPDYVIATKTCIKMDKVGMSAIASLHICGLCSQLRLPSRMQTKEYFARQKPQPRSKNAADNLFVDAATAAGKKAYKLKEERKEDQKLVDKRVIEAIKRNKHAKMLFAYLRSQFSLSRHDKPHRMYPYAWFRQFKRIKRGCRVEGCTKIRHENEGWWNIEAVHLTALHTTAQAATHFYTMPSDW
ncbi:60S ribosomal protein L6 [Echinococcus granulosus]|uniref:Large ribosomal subunit protein eL6 n=1 Tax=Echinococcus granulosus TaxID=6210 RepID=W6U2T6_ECHGR|nr:60S ribosomal protein L6 [Echinococcus granulosus]EUB55393.1 60S ribosomal protein L6 [Echinococcus granulosus]